MKPRSCETFFYIRSNADPCTNDLQQFPVIWNTCGGRDWRFRIFLKLTRFTITQNFWIFKIFGRKGILSWTEQPGIVSDFSSYQQVMLRAQRMQIIWIVTHDRCEGWNLMSLPLCHPSSCKQPIIHTHISNPS